MIDADQDTTAVSKYCAASTASAAQREFKQANQ